MRQVRGVPVGVVRDRVIRVQNFVGLAERLDELETGVPEHLRQLPALHGLLDELERDVLALLEVSLARHERGNADG